MKHLKRIVSYSLAMCVLILSPATTTAYNEGKDSSKSEETADYILNNLDEFSESYNSQIDQNDGDYFNPTNCEYRISVNILDSDEKAVYIDFNDDNGYMVVSEDEIVKFEPSGDLDYLRSFGGEIFYSTIDDRFAYYDNKELIFFEHENDKNCDISPNASYAGVSEGRIVDPDKYLKDRYGSLTLYDARHLDNSIHESEDYLTQFKASIYTKTQTYSSEGNCALVAIYNSMMYIRNNVKGVLSNIPPASFTAIVNPTSDPFYKQALLHNYTAQSKNLPCLYYVIRNFAISDYGYTVYNGKLPDGCSSGKSLSTNLMTEFINKVANYFNQSSFVSYYRGANITEFTASIKQNYPAIVNLSADDPVYGDHSVVLTGYLIYKKYTTVLGIKTCTKTVNIIRILDGWIGDTNYIFYDASAASSSMKTMISFIP